MADRGGCGGGAYAVVYVDGNVDDISDTKRSFRSMTNRENKSVAEETRFQTYVSCDCDETYVEMNVLDFYVVSTQSKMASVRQHFALTIEPSADIEIYDS